MLPDISSFWHWVASVLLGILLALVDRQRREDRNKAKEELDAIRLALKEACEKRDALALIVAESRESIRVLNTLVGTNGNGYRDYLVYKNALGGLPSRITFRVSANGVTHLTPDLDSIDIQPIVSLTPGRIVIAYLNESGATVTMGFKCYDVTGAELTAATVVSCGAETVVTTGGTASQSALTVTRDATNNWFAVSFSRVAGSLYKAFPRITVSSNTAATEYVYPLPTYNPTAVGGVPRFATCTINIAAAGGAGLAVPVTLRYTTNDAPVSYTVNATLTVNGTPTNGTVRVLTGVITDDTIATGRRTADGASSPYLTQYTINGTITMYDSSGNVLASRAIPTTTYYGA